jgi:hypothetical protein
MRLTYASSYCGMSRSGLLKTDRTLRTKSNVSCTTLTQLLHNSNYFFSFFEFVFLRVGPIQ